MLNYTAFILRLLNLPYTPTIDEVSLPHKRRKNLLRVLQSTGLFVKGQRKLSTFDSHYDQLLETKF